MKLLLHRTAVLAAVVVVLAACQPKPADTAADEAALRAGTVAWVEAYNAGEADKIVAMYAEDAIMMPPDAPAAAGPQAMRKFLTADIAATRSAGLTLALVDEATGVSGDLGWHAGTFRVVDGSGATAGTGKFSEVWRRTNGKWLMIRDIWNNDAPPAPPAAPALSEAPAITEAPAP